MAQVNAASHPRQYLRTLLRVGLYALTVILLCLFQSAAFTHSRQAALVCAYLVPAWVSAVTLYEGITFGAWFGVLSGLFCDAAGGDRIYLLPLLYLVVALCTGLLCGSFLRRGTMLVLLSSATSTLLCAVFFFVRDCIVILAHGEELSLLLLFFAAAKTVLQVFVLSLPLHIPACIISRIRRETNAQIGIRSAFHSTAPSPVRR